MGERLKGKVALVTGAGSIGPGIGNGKATAILFAREGAAVVALDISADAVAETRQMIEAEGGRCIALTADVTRAEDCRRAVAQCIGSFGRIDILHNNVGITDSGGPVEYAEDAWDRMMAVNVKSMFLTAKFALPHMEAQGSGSIINIGSINAIRAIPFPKLAYAASKAAVIGLTREIALQYAPKGIRANVILPGFIRAPIVEQRNLGLYGGDLEAMWKTRDAMSPTGKQGEPWDIANAAVFLASDESAYVNGVVLPVDGGAVQQIKF
jgi:NAD(P)-dependent dehydrogenase (short-subunit alcohol dehydrogenase family)